ncbi:MAG: beta-ketoacyl-ACP synthase II [Anaerolineales bacterium]|nr:MAG: beta-ketoacyl-ACP synthase II [Anaerolineales bacterium]
MPRRVVVTGMGAITPIGNDVTHTWEALKAGESGIARITQFDPSDLATQFAGEVKGFDPNARFGRKEARRMDRVTQFAMEICSQAVTDSRLLENGNDRDRVGVVVSSAVGGISTLLSQHDVLKSSGPRRISPFFIPMMLVDTPSAQVAIEYGLRGPNMSIVTACATGTNAIGEAFEMIARGAADAMLAGGCEAGLHPITIAGFNVMGALSTHNEDPAGACRPFDANRDGFVVGEGGAVLVIEELEHALARGATIHAEIVGYGTSVDANHMAAPVETGDGARLAMRNALDRAQLPSESVDYVNAHGTSTRINDPIETRAIKDLMGEHAYNIAVTSSKSMTGHLLGGAGALEALICVKVLEDGIIPPTINYETPDPDCDLDYVPNQARQAEVRVAMSNSFGFGGHNACLTLCRYE